MPIQWTQKDFELINNLTAGVALKYFEAAAGQEAAVEGVAIFECGGGGVKLIYCIRVTGTEGALKNKPYVLQLDCGKNMMTTEGGDDKKMFEKGKIMYEDIHNYAVFNTEIEKCHKAMCTWVGVPYVPNHKKIVFSSGFVKEIPACFNDVDLTQAGVVLTQPQEAEYEFNALKMVFSDSKNIASVHMGSQTTQINSSTDPRQLGSGLPGYKLNYLCDKIILTSTCAAIGDQFGWNQTESLFNIIEKIVEKFRQNKIGGAQYDISGDGWGG